MQRNTVIIYMVMSLVSLIIIVLTYFGYIRYWKCKFRKCTSFADAYLKLPRVDSDSKVIVSLSSNAKNLKDIEPTINSLLDQTVHPDQIILNLTDDNTSLDVPSFLKDNKIIVVHKLSPDYHESASFLSPLLREKDANAKIIVVDDKHVYGVDLIETLADASAQNPDKAIYIKGYKASSYLKDNKSLDQGDKNDIMSISHGVLIKPKFLGEDILETSKSPVQAKDVVLSANLAKNHVKLHKVNYKDSFIRQKPSQADIERDKSAILFYAIDLEV